MFAVWDESYSVGVEEIDNQHKKLFEIINNLHDAMKVGKGKEVSAEILQGLLDYTHYHFSTEEKYFDEFHYQESIRHKQVHKEFTKKIQDFYNSYLAGETTVSIEILKFLNDWLVNHIKGTDQRYKECFQEHGLH